MKIGVPYSHGKRYKKNNRKINKKKVCVVVCIVIILISIVSYYWHKTNNPGTKTKEDAINTAQAEEPEEDVEENQEDPKELTGEVVENDLPDTMGNYKVIGELVIEKIGVKNNILETTDENSLNLSVTKFYGVDVNKVGNICITGHNYSRMLKRLSELTVGDTFYMINKEESTKVEYKVFDIYTCNPTDLECLNPRYNGVKEVTLITCNPGGLTRLICKAKEI